MKQRSPGYGSFLLTAAFGIFSVDAQTPAACAPEQKLLTSLETQLQTSIADESKPTCDGPAKTVCVAKTKSIQDQISAAQAYIRSGCPAGKTPAPLPFDPVSAQQDPNGFLLNPTWYWQKANPGQLIDPAICGGRPWELSCTNLITWIDNSWKCSANGLLGGHANWTVATFTGNVFWSSHSAPGTDDDYNIDLYRSDNAALTVNAERSATLNGTPVLHMEFDSDETIDHFHTSWWTSFHSAVDKGDSNARAIIDGHDAVAVGLLGLDYAHSGGTELHPLLALAIHLTTTASSDTWAIFVRNRGDEGYCSSGEEYASFTSLSMLLPRPGVTNVQIGSAEFLFGPDSMSAADKALIKGTVATQPQQGAILTFTLPQPASGARINGILTLNWTGAQPYATTKVISPAKPVGASTEDEEPERVLAESLAHLTPAQLAAYQKLTTPATPVYDSAKLAVASSKVSGAATRSSKAAPVADAQKDAADRVKATALKQILGN